MSEYFLFPMGTDRTKQTKSSEATITVSEDGEMLNISIPIVSLPFENVNPTTNYSETHRMLKPTDNLCGANISTIVFGCQSDSSTLQLTVDLKTKVPLSGGGFVSA
jgi:hypothetical protein